MKKISFLLLSLSAVTCMSACNVSNSSSSSNSSGSQASSSSDHSSSQEQTGNKDFTGISFANGEFDYDGQAHSIYVSGAPEFATVTYLNNNKINVGSYTVTATISAENYNTLTKTATLRIVGQTITGVTFEDSTITYDGEAHSIYVAGDLPSGVSASYSNNNKTDSGTYTVTANLSGVGYEPLKLTAKLTINPVPLDNPGNFYSKAFIYDGSSHSAAVENAPSSASITYKCLNASGTNTFKNVGTYEVEATIKTDKNHQSKSYALLTITAAPTAGTDSTKTALAIDENLTWDQLYDALSNDNFTMEYLSGSYDVENIDDPMPSNLFDKSYTGHKSGYVLASDGKEAFKHNYPLNDDEVTNYYDFYKESGNNIIHLNFGDEYHTSSTVKFPKAAFSETVAKDASANAFVALTKGDNGEFLPGINKDDFYSDVGSAYIENNEFIVLMEHPRTLSSGDYRYFYTIYKFSNIGNTKVTVLSSCLPSQNYIDNNMATDACVYGGVKYSGVYYGTASNMKYYFAAQLYVSNARAVYQGAGTYTVLSNVLGRKVTAIVDTKGDIYKTNQSGYEYLLPINSEGVYQGEDAQYGSLDKFDISSGFINRGGTVKYYDEWHE